MPNLLHIEYYQENKLEINRTNLSALRLFALINIPISVLDLMAQAAFEDMNLLPSTCMIIYSVFLYLAVHFGVKDSCRKATLLLYLAEIPPILGAVLNGSVFDPTHLANSYMIYVILMPVMILDFPIRVIFYQGAFCCLLLYLSSLVKTTGNLFRSDQVNVVRALILAFALDMVVTAARMKEIDRARRAEIEATKDPLTGLGNRPRFDRDAQLAMKETVALVCFDVSSYRLTTEIFGHEIGDRLILAFSETLRDHFREEDLYRWSESRFIVMMKGSYYIQVHLQHSVHQCVADFEEITIDNSHMRPILSIGYVIDVPGDRGHLMDMIRLADLRTYQAQVSSTGQVIGGDFDETMLEPHAIAQTMVRYEGMAAKDELTGLLRLTSFVSICENLIGQRIISSDPTCILYFNVLGMKRYNEKYGFSEGDRLIRDIADAIIRHLPGRSATRTGGDHFMVFCYVREVSGVDKIEQDIMEEYKSKKVRLSVGQYTLRSGDHIALACDRAKIAADSIRGQDRLLRVYDEELEKMLNTERFLTNHLKHAIVNRQIVAYFQPIYDAQSGEMCSCEALARWIDPERGMISPAVFIPVLENARLIKTLDMAILDDVLRNMAIRKKQRHKLYPVSVNLSRYDIECGAIVEEITEKLDRAGIDHSLIAIEITESAFTDNEDRINEVVDEFQSHGFEVWMDDFGSGYSSLHMLQETSFDLIKLDMRFMRTKNPERGMILVREIINMAHALGIKTLVEGVETYDQVVALKDMGCGRIQGFYYSKPLAREDFYAYISEHKK